MLKTKTQKILKEQEKKIKNKLNACFYFLVNTFFDQDFLLHFGHFKYLVVLICGAIIALKYVGINLW